MANNANMEEQVARLSRSQQDTILKVGKIATALQLIGFVPWMINVVLGLWKLINPPVGMGYEAYDALFIKFMIWIVVGVVYILGIFVFVKVKYPEYSDAKWRYINKMRKSGALSENKDVLFN